MSIPISIDNLLRENVVEWAQIEFKEGWNPDTTLKTISAFANDFDNWGGGYIVIGAKEKNGKIVHPVSGLNKESIDDIQKEILKYCNYLTPKYIPESEVVEYEGKHLLLLWCPGGYDRPYKCPKKPTSDNHEKIYYIRKLSSTIEASDADVKELISLTHNIPFDDRINVKADIKDLKFPLIKNYLQEVNSNLLFQIENKSIENIASSLKIVDGPKEYYKPLNVGLLFFNDNPDNFFPYCQIEVVNIPDPTGQEMEERVFKGPIDQQLRDVLRYIENNVIVEKVFKTSDKAEAIRVKNYSYEALEEFISNAVYHRSYQLHDPITIRIESDKIEITSTPGPDKSISDADIKNLKMRSRRYRNRRIGDFLKELHLVEGRNTGIPTALRGIEKNGSPFPEFITDEDRTFFSVILPINKCFDNRINKTKKRKSKEEIKELIIDKLDDKDASATSLYQDIGYSGNMSKTFRSCIEELILESKIKYLKENINSSNNLLTKIG